MIHHILDASNETCRSKLKCTFFRNPPKLMCHTRTGISDGYVLRVKNNRMTNVCFQYFQQNGYNRKPHIGTLHWSFMLYLVLDTVRLLKMIRSNFTVLLTPEYTVYLPTPCGTQSVHGRIKGDFGSESSDSCFGKTDCCSAVGSGQVGMQLVRSAQCKYLCDM